MRVHAGVKRPQPTAPADALTSVRGCSAGTVYLVADLYCICQLVPINAALEISPHGEGSTAISICTRTFYVHTTRLILEAVYARACRSL